MARRHQSTIVKSYSSQHFNRHRKYELVKKEPPIHKLCKIRSRNWGGQQFLPRCIISEDSWAMRNHHPFQSQDKGFQWSHWRFPTQVKQRGFLCYGHVWLWWQCNPVRTNKNRQASTIGDAFLNIHKVLKARCRNPKNYIMDNKCSRYLKEAMKNYDIDFQLAPPHMHRQNAAERSIRTCKNHFLALFSTTDPDFPIS